MILLKGKWDNKSIESLENRKNMKITVKHKLTECSFGLTRVSPNEPTSKRHVINIRNCGKPSFSHETCKSAWPHEPDPYKTWRILIVLKSREVNKTWIHSENWKNAKLKIAWKLEIAECSFGLTRVSPNEPSAPMEGRKCEKVPQDAPMADRHVPPSPKCL